VGMGPMEPSNDPVPVSSQIKEMNWQESCVRGLRPHRIVRPSFPLTFNIWHQQNPILPIRPGVRSRHWFPIQRELMSLQTLIHKRQKRKRGIKFLLCLAELMPHLMILFYCQFQCYVPSHRETSLHTLRNKLNMGIACRTSCQGEEGIFARF